MAIGSDAEEAHSDGPAGTVARAQPMSRAAKEAITEVFDVLGGVDAMVRWVMSDSDNQKAFYSSIYPKLIPAQLADEEQPVEQELTIRFV